MRFFTAPVENLIEQFQKLPGVGRKTAQRLAFFILSLPEAEAEGFANAVINAKKLVKFCSECQNLTDTELCSICADNARDKTTVCVVSDPKDVAAIEKTREYNGLYHVLHGCISPMNGIGPDDVRIKELLTRVAKGEIKEVIMATNPDTEGEATAMYISRLLKPFGISTTRLAYGIPVGGHLEFADEMTLTRAIEGRRIMD
ncbi:MAG: recombination protein RecR [Oscillospiraceae bacterium]|nr:recombination protein RecR [Oscillospiraceae bacterium]MBQ6697817.1 recombination protein RecR [Oscillospiraceae bacterium]MBQ7053769.1 recombination protein RecR [Oscillospiraceae bacterium]